MEQQIKAAIFKIQPLQEQEWQELAEKLVFKSFDKGATRNYFIRKDKDFTVDFQFQGDFVTAYYSLITREPSEVFIELLEASEVAAIPLEYLNEFYTKYHNGERIGRLIAEYQYARRLRKEMDLLSHNAEERYAQLMRRNPGLVQTISVKHLSSYLGIQPESLSRIRKQAARN